MVLISQVQPLPEAENHPKVTENYGPRIRKLNCVIVTYQKKTSKKKQNGLLFAMDNIKYHQRNWYPNLTFICWLVYCYNSSLYLSYHLI